MYMFEMIRVHFLDIQRVYIRNRGEVKHKETSVILPAVESLHTVHGDWNEDRKTMLPVVIDPSIFLMDISRIL